MAQKIRDIVVSTGTYQKDGQTKNRYQNVGVMMKNDDGGEFIILHRWFNPAGIPNPNNKDSVLLSCFRPNGGQSSGNSGQPQGQPAADAPTGGFDDFDDDIPFDLYQRNTVA